MPKPRLCTGISSNSSVIWRKRVQVLKQNVNKKKTRPNYLFWFIMMHEKKNCRSYTNTYPCAFAKIKTTTTYKQPKATIRSPTHVLDSSSNRPIVWLPVRLQSCKFTITWVSNDKTSIFHTWTWMYTDRNASITITAKIIWKSLTYKKRALPALVPKWGKSYHG